MGERVKVNFGGKEKEELRKLREKKGGRGR